MNMKNLNAQIDRVKKSMNRPAILNELQRCAERVTDEHYLPTEAWEVWFRGTHLGSIERKYKGCYAVHSSLGRHCGDCATYMESLARFIDSCSVVIAKKELEEVEEWINEVVKEPELRVWGIREPKTMWQKIKGWFK